MKQPSDWTIVWWLAVALKSLLILGIVVTIVGFLDKLTGLIKYTKKTLSGHKYKVW